ncbi:2862_t:CDS:2 [Funneliformis caledonium]|uniref:2862_t:CDS:1 n=1 Tax=Funneliformis caledonium TaxID=1117310 RepID=A0A9N9EM66_9GLOM|nr:2862_t:CDS:2 [Funneliformis caledonium]
MKLRIQVPPEVLQIFNRIREEKRYILEEMCLHMAMGIRELGFVYSTSTMADNKPYPGNAALITYLDNNDPSNWSFSDFLSSNFNTIVNSPPDASDINTLNGTWWKRFTFEVEAKGHKAVKGHLLGIQKIFYNVISTRLEITRQQNITISKSKVNIIADKQGINLVRASCEFHGSEMIAEYSLNRSNPKRDLNGDDIESYLFSKKRRSTDDYTSTPPNRIRNSSPQPYNEESSSSNSEIRNSSPQPYNEESSSSDSEIAPVSLTNVFSEVQKQESNNLTESNIKATDSKGKKSTRGYINNDIAKEVLMTYGMCVLLGKKLIYRGVDILGSAHTNMGKSGATKSPLCIGVINVHNSDCTKFLSDEFKNFISSQLQDPECQAIYFDKEQHIPKFVVDCEVEVIQFLKKFSDVGDLESLAKCLNENQIDMGNASNDLIYARTLLDHFFFMYKNDILLQPMSECELNTYIWTPLIRKAFFGRADMKLSCGELASNSYEKLKELLNIGGRSAPRLDGKGLLKALGTELLVQEDGVLSTRGKRKGDLNKLEYCLKIILTTLYIALPTSAKDYITQIEAYSLQSNGFRLTVSVSKYLFENAIITMDLQDVEIPKTVEGFPKLIKAIKVILSWKSRTRKNTQRFYEVLKLGNENGTQFSPKKISA